MASKGKAVATGKDSGGGKRKRGGNGGKDDDKTGGERKKRNREILQFFEDEADLDDYESDDSDFNFSDIDGYVDEEFDIELKVKNEPARAPNPLFVPKEEELDEEEFDKMMEERYKNNPIFGGYAQDSLENKRLMERDLLLPSAKDPTIWKVKCMVGRERHSAFCLMQKFVDLKSLGTKLQIISAFAVDHVKGFIFVEAEKQCNINEACKGLCSIYSSRVAPVPKNEVSHMLSIPSKHNQVTEGMWARVKNGKYKGDLAQIVAVNHARRRATVKLIPRIDLQAMAQKFGGGVAVKTAATPAPRLMSSSELEEFRPLIQYKRDRDTGKMFEVLDGLMLKDGYLYKRVSVDSLNCCGVVPSEEELLKFKPSENNESDNLEWLTQLYGGPKKKRILGNDKGGEKGESSSGSGMHNSFELYNLVCFGRKDFGLIVGMEKDNYYKILKHGQEAPAVVTVELHDLKNGPSDMKFTALDHRMKIISINDTVRIVEGPLKDRQGIVKQIYRGIVFINDQNETDNGGYFCSKAQLCEKIKLSFDASYEKGGDPGPLGFEDFSSSPKSPLSPKRQWQARENNRDSNRGDKNGIFSIGQTLRIRVGPLKGYLCNVMAIRYSDVTVKLGSQQKVLTVKSEHLSEVGGKSSAIAGSDDPATSSLKPFDLLGGEGGSTDWTDGAGTSVEGDRWNAGGAGTSVEGDRWSAGGAGTSVESDRWNTGGGGTSRDGDGWNAGGLSAERSSWPSVRAPGSTLTELSLENPSNSAEAAWQGKETSNQNSAWGAAIANDKAVAKNEDGWNKAAVIGTSSSASDGWGKATLASENLGGSSRDSGDNCGQANFKGNSSIDHAAAWDKGKRVIEKPTGSWGNAALVKNQLESWSEGNSQSEGGQWENKSSSTGEDCWNNKGTGWNQQKSHENRDTWGKAVEVKGKDAVQEGSWEKPVEAKGNDAVQEDSWGKAAEGRVKGAIQVDSWSKAAEKWDTKSGSSERKAEWKNSTRVSEKMTKGWGSSGRSSSGGSWNQPEDKNADETSAWMKAKDDSASQTANWDSGNNVTEDASGWTKGGSGNKYQTDTWNKSKTSGVDGGSSWSKLQGESSWGKQGGGSSWSKPQGESSWAKQDGGSSWSKPQGESSWTNQDGGSSWSKPQGESSSGKQEGGSSWNKKSRDQDFSGWNKEQDGGYGSGGRRGRGGGRGGMGGRGQFGTGRSYGEGQSSSWKDGGGNKWSSDGRSSKNPSGWSNDRAGSSWNKFESQGAGEKWGYKDGSSEGEAEWKSSSATDKPTGGWDNLGGSLNQSEAENVDKTSGWMKAKDDSASQSANWASGKNVIEEASGWTKGGSGGQDQTDTWNKHKASSVGGGSSWSKPQEESSWGKQDGGSSWSKPQEASSWSKQDGGSSWSKPRGESSWGKQDGGSSWSKPQRESSWGKQDGGPSWSKPQGESSWGKQDGGSSSSKPQGESCWFKQEGGSSWNKQDRDQGFGGWNKEQDGGYGSGGRRGRGGGGRRGRGGRGQYGRGRSYGEGQFSSWKDSGGNNCSDGTSLRKPSGWSNDRAGRSWNKLENHGAGEKWGSKDGSSEGKAEWKSSSATDKPTEGWGNQGGSWNQPMVDNVDKTSGWMKAKDDSTSQSANWASGKNVAEDASGWTKGGSGNQDETDTWNKPKASGVDGVSSWRKPQGESSWGKQEEGSSWNKQQGESPWGKQEGGSSWNKQERDQEFGGWNKTRDGGCESGGKMGRECGGGSRDQFGRGRSSGGGQNSNWKGGANWTGAGTSPSNPSGSRNDQAGSGWKNSEDNRAVQEDSWGKIGEKWATKDGSNENKAEWKNSASQAEKPSEGGCGNPGGSWN